MGLWNKIKNGLKKALVVGAMSIVLACPRLTPEIKEQITPTPTTPITTPIVDREPPEIYFNEDTVELLPNEEVNYRSGVSAYDRNDGPIHSSNISYEGFVGSEQGIFYPVTYKVSDKAGNTTAATRNFYRVPEGLVEFLNHPSQISDGNGGYLTIEDAINSLGYSIPKQKCLNPPSGYYYYTNGKGTDSNGNKWTYDTDIAHYFNINPDEFFINFNDGYGDHDAILSGSGTDISGIFYKLDYNGDNIPEIMGTSIVNASTKEREIIWLGLTSENDNWNIFSDELNKIPYSKGNNIPAPNEYNIYNEDWSKIKEVTNSSSTPPISFPDNNRQRFSFKNSSKKNPLLENLAA